MESSQREMPVSGVIKLGIEPVDSCVTCTTIMRQAELWVARIGRLLEGIFMACIAVCWSAFVFVVDVA